jgi:hypothetical protein
MPCLLMHDKIVFNISKKDYNQTKKLTDNFLKEDNILKIRNITEKFGFDYKINVNIEIVSAEIKYIFNYLSGAFENNDLREGAKNIKKFLNGSKFKESIKHLSGRAIYDKKVIKKVILSLSYLKNSDLEFIPLLKNLCNRLINKLKIGESIILIGVSRYEKIMPFDRLLVHELFHLILFDNKIKFGEISKKYAKFDEGLAIFFSYVWGGNIKKILDIKNDFDRQAAMFWYKKLILIPSKKEFDEIKRIYYQYKR